MVVRSGSSYRFRRQLEPDMEPVLGAAGCPGAPDGRFAMHGLTCERAHAESTVGNANRIWCDVLDAGSPKATIEGMLHH